MNYLLPFLLGLISGFLIAPAVLQEIILATREPYRGCDEYAESEYGYFVAETKIDHFLDDLTSDRSTDA
jgi:hypothetical protein